MRTKDDLHAAFLDGEARYPEHVARAVQTMLDDVATYVSREELPEAIGAAYGAVGIHEDWLAEAATPEARDA